MSGPSVDRNSPSLPEMTAVGHILTRTWKWSDFDWEKNPQESKQGAEIRKEMATRGMSLSERGLEETIGKWKSGKRLSLTGKGPLVLPPLKREPRYLALLSVEWPPPNKVASKKPPVDDATIQLHLVSRNPASIEAEKTGNPVGGKIPRFLAVGLHFDPPNNAPFNFRHLQLIHSYGAGWDWAYEHWEPGWLPSDLPRVPIPATNLPGIFLSLLCGLYGWQSVWEHILSNYQDAKSKQLLEHVLEAW